MTNHLAARLYDTPTPTTEAFLEYFSDVIEKFDNECSAGDYTDTDEVWSIFNEFRARIERII